MRSRHQPQPKTIFSNLGLSVVCIGLAYLFFSLSIDKGNLFYYLFTLIALVYFLKFGARLIKGIYEVIFK